MHLRADVNFPKYRLLSYKLEFHIGPNIYSSKNEGKENAQAKSKPIYLLL